MNPLFCEARSPIEGNSPTIIRLVSPVAIPEGDQDLMIRAHHSDLDAKNIKAVVTNDRSFKIEADQLKAHRAGGQRIIPSPLKRSFPRSDPGEGPSLTIFLRKRTSRQYFIT